MPKTLSAKYYQENKETLKEEKEKKQQYVVNVTKICEKMKNKSFLSIEKNIIE